MSGGVIQRGELPFYKDAAGNAITHPGPGDLVLHTVECPPGSGTEHYEYVVLAEFVDRQALINGAYDEAVSAIPLPSLDISPSPEARGVVNLGLWLAVTDPGQVNAFSNVGAVWASVTARFTGTSWEMGNGDVVECAGLGSPYPGGDIAEQGPCGYTYRVPSSGDGYAVTVTGRWEVQLITSDGVNEMLDPIDVSYGFGYPVDEIVTVVES